MVKEENRQSSLSLSQDKVAPLPRNRKAAFASSGTITNRTTPMPPPRRANSQQRFVFTTLFFCFCLIFVFGFVHTFHVLIFSVLLFSFFCKFSDFISSFLNSLSPVFSKFFSISSSLFPTFSVFLMRVFGDGLWCLGFFSVHFDSFIIFFQN